MSFKPASLAQLFEPPTGYRGFFGWLCGYAADAGFLEDALERFSGLTRAQRAHQGRILLAAMLDPGNPQIGPVEMPGALHLPVRVAKLPFALLHAKVAVLGFQGADRFVLRVIVSTGNWTSQTLRESLDLAWHVDVFSKDEDADAEVVRQNRTDLAAVWDFLWSLQESFDLRLLELAAGIDNESADAAARLTEWIAEIGKRHRGYRPRFFDSRRHSLIAQLPDLVRHHAAEVRRNYLALGSGFFEGEGSSDTFVPEQILEALQKSELVTASCEKDIFVNPLACQAVATRQSWIEQERGWTIRVARAPAYFGAAPRALHAKFIFSANWQKGSNNCSRPWVYLGSGNLTSPGFMNRAGSAGNLEAGVVFAPETLRWEVEGKRDDGANVITNLLPIHWDDADQTPLPVLQVGQDMPERDTAFIAAPVALFLWDERSELASLTPQGDVRGPFALHDPDGRSCECLADGSFVWPGKRPRQVTVVWSVEEGVRKASVPVIDRYGRYGAGDLPALDLEEAWIQLANFPMPPEDEELVGGDSADTVDGVVSSGVASSTTSSSYPVRRMMILVEEIAAKQVAIGESDWSMWCNRLEQILTQAKDSAVVRAFQSIALNPLHPLFAPAFRPAFAATAQTQQGARYEAALNAAITAWQLEGYSKLGERR
ncbi:phospholipase D-like domain-containing protein [Dyella agri]|uniref:PLD phosphodiesterase domain-containing protein n=1 Tax=Dyella agri TaxID=1926869 RepID=A0ABW8KCT0_9GAMM